jgi:hypothetical protein
MSGIWLCLGVTFHTYRGQGLLNLLESVYNFYQILKNFVYDTFIYVYFFFLFLSFVLSFGDPKYTCIRPVDVFLKFNGAY